jgi:hypothetical protein
MNLGALLMLMLSATPDAGAGMVFVYGPPAEANVVLECPPGTRQETTVDYDARVAFHLCNNRKNTSPGPAVLQGFDGKPVASRDDVKTCLVLQPAVLARSKFRDQFAGCAAK